MQRKYKISWGIVAITDYSYWHYCWSSKTQKCKGSTSFHGALWLLQTIHIHVFSDSPIIELLDNFLWMDKKMQGIVQEIEGCLDISTNPQKSWMEKNTSCTCCCIFVCNWMYSCPIRGANNQKEKQHIFQSITQAITQIY